MLRIPPDTLIAEADAISARELPLSGPWFGYCGTHLYNRAPADTDVSAFSWRLPTLFYLFRKLGIMQSEKAKQRTHALAKRLELEDLSLRHEHERHILINVCKVLNDIKLPGIVAGYAPIRGEVDALKMLTALYQQGFEIALPIVRKDCENRLEFGVHHPDAELLEGYSGILEPLPERDVVLPRVLLVPLLGFNANCHRLGYGAGHYDRTLAYFKKIHHKVTTIGLAFEFQKNKDIIVEAHDQPLDYVVTEKHIYNRYGGDKH